MTSIAPNSLTLVVLMGLATRVALTTLLLDRGWDPSTPTAVLYAASTPQAFTWIGALDELAAAHPGGGGQDAGTIVIGQVVGVGVSLGLAATRSMSTVAVRRRSGSS